MAYKINTVAAGVETTVLEIVSNNRDAAAMARAIRNETGLEVRVYDNLGLRGVMDAIAA